MHQNSRLMFAKFCAPYFREGMNVLEIGGTGEITDPKRILAAAGVRVEFVQCALRGADDETSEFGPRNVKVWMPDEYTIPQPDNSWDAVVALNVLEHVRMPWRWINELARVTKPNGFVALVAPISWPYHPVPVDCFRYYPEGLRALFEDAGLVTEVAEMGSLNPPITRRFFYGESVNEVPHHSLRRTIMKLIGWPLPTSLDLAGIGRKPG